MYSVVSFECIGVVASASDVVSSEVSVHAGLGCHVDLVWSGYADTAIV